MTDPADWKPLSPAFTAALRRYDQAARARVLRAQRRDAITAPLFHYTDRGGLSGIITNEQFWFTHYQHLNDDKEIAFGMEIANAVLAEFGARWRKAKIFCDVVADLFSTDNINSVFDFLESPGFAGRFGSCGEAERVHVVGVLTISDEFRAMPRAAWRELCRRANYAERTSFPPGFTLIHY